MEQEDKEVIRLIDYDQNGDFVFNSNAEQFLNSLDKNQNLGVISIVGKQRTGKSFFVNRVLLNLKNEEQSGFQVGASINPCTKGLNIYSNLQQAKNPLHPNLKILVIDTEGQDQQNQMMFQIQTDILKL